MSNADVFRSLAQDMANAQKEGTKRIAEIEKETAQLLRDIGKENKERSAEVKSLLQDFARAHSEMASQLRTELGKVKPELAKVKAELAKVKPEIAAAESERKNQAEMEVRERAVEIKSLLAAFDKEENAMAAQLKAELAKVKSEITAAESERKNQAEAEIRARKFDVSSLLEGFKKDLAETATAWRELAATIQVTRGVAVAPRPVKSSKAVAEKPPAANVKKEMPGEKANPGKKVRLEEQILALISEHPEGIKLTEIAERTGVARIKAGNVTRMLVDEGKIIKEGLFYFSV